MKFIALLVLIIALPVRALEVDEKLTVRVLKTSETRKTIMINRGTEDGLVEGDHAKFIVTAGIVARAVCVKISPARSIWSVYRLVNADFIVNDSVMSIKITPPVKVTKDESKSLVQEDTPAQIGTGDAAQLGIPLADGAQDLGSVTDQNLSQADLKALEGDVGPASIPEKNFEVFGILNISGINGSTKTNTGSDTFNNSQSNHHIGLGAELYAQREREWYSHFSLQAMLNVMRADSQAYDGSAITNDVSEFTGGINWHPTKLPSQTMAFIPYFNLTAGIGSVKSTFKPGQESSGGNEISANGTTTSFSAGFGYKFFTGHGFSVRALLDYYMRSEKYKEDEALFTFNKTVSGPRFMLGIGYRF